MAALQQTHGLEAPERTVERAVRSQQPAIGVISKLLGQLVSVKLVVSTSPQPCGRGADGLLQGNEGTRFPAHAEL